MLNYSQVLNSIEDQFGIATVRHGILIIHPEFWIHYLPKFHKITWICEP